MGPNILQKRNYRSSRNDFESAMDYSSAGWKPGECTTGSCGTEAACHNFSNKTHTCVCPHDSSPPTNDLRCPNRRTVPITPGPIHNIIPPSAANMTLNSSSSSPSPSLATTDSVLGESSKRTFENWLMGISAFGAAISVLLIALIFIYLWHRRHSKSCFKRSNKGKHGAPVSLSKSLLEQERYISNPQYIPCALQSLPMLNRDSLTFLHDIGQGCFGKVYKGELRLEGFDAQIVAIKVLKESATKEAEDDFMREVEIMSTFRHTNILTLIGVVPRDGNKNPCMVFEFMPYGDLAEVLRGNSRHFSKPSFNVPRLTKEGLISAALQIAAGMCYLASQRFVHRDLACRNCLVGENLSVKIADFGMSRDIYTCDYYKVGESKLLPVRWMSPESVVYGRFTLESDVWSYGVVLWEIFSLGKQPYFGHSNEEVLKLILQGIMLVPPEDSPFEICELMKSCWKSEPKDRIHFSEIYDHLKKLLNQSRQVTQRSTLPRPPAFPIGLTTQRSKSAEDILDSDNYLQPQGGTREYLQPLPD
ncbi:tyrosine-protein kinase transmembrane receptor Ror-like [Lycorma delicatula]|uniref:tyrosine-protein kinase transmembrane receptor Ror-like n=1 Tax=Lycorma delicatula TaxID=130591 RepID=UPI003F5139F2